MCGPTNACSKKVYEIVISREERLLDHYSWLYTDKYKWLKNQQNLQNISMRIEALPKRKKSFYAFIK